MNTDLLYHISLIQITYYSILIKINNFSAKINSVNLPSFIE